MRDIVRVEMQSRTGVMAYQVGSRHHGYRTGCLPQKRLGSLSVLAVPGTNGGDPTIPFDRNSGERGCSFEVVRDQTCRRGSGSQSQSDGIDPFHLDGWIV